MGTFIGLKITDLEMQNKGMTSMAGTRWLNQAETLKAKLDEDGTFVAQRLGQVLDALEASTAAASIGADVASVSTKTVQAILTAFETRIADRYTITQVDTKVTQETNDLVKTVVFNDGNGTFTITKKDGSVTVIDTLLEKIPVSMTFETVGGVTRIKLVNHDGTVSYADVTALVDNYTFSNTPTVSLTASGVGNQRTVTADVRDASLGLEKLNLAAVGTLQGYVNTAGASATAANNSATAASGSATTATNKATEAANSASTAVTKATESASSATASANSATNADSSKNNALSYANTSATNATNSSISSTQSQSWAIGATGTRAGEDTNNAKYWAEQAQTVVGEKVATFNGRGGVVVPQTGDYTPEMTGAAALVHTHNATDINTDATHRFVTDTEKTAWNALSGGVKNGLLRDLNIMLNLSLGTSNIDAWADLLNDTSRINVGASSGYTVMNGNLSSLISGTRVETALYNNLGRVTTNNQKLGQTFKALHTTLNTITVRMAKSGSPTSTITAKIYTVSGGIPSSLIATSTNTINGAGLTSTHQDTTFNFSGLSLTIGTTYAFSLEVNTLNDANFYTTLCYDVDTQYLDGTMVKANNGVWEQNYRDMYFKIAYGNTATVVWNATTSTVTFAKMAIAGEQTLGIGAITFYVSPNGTAWTQITALNAAQAVSFTGTSVYLKAVITGNASLSSVAWGGI